MIRVVLVDDHRDFRWITRCVLDLHPEVEVVGEAANGVEALTLVAQVQPDVVLMDVQMPLLDGIATTRQMRVAYPDVPIVLFTGGDDADAVREGMQAGAVGYLLKTTCPDLLVAALRAASHREAPIRGRAAERGG